MQREIMFRAWDAARSEMLYTNLHDRSWYYTPENDEHGCHAAYDKTQRDAHYLITMQFTGLKDRNKKDIYEGDYLSHPHDNLTIFEVFYHDGEGCFKLRAHYINPRCGGCVPPLNSEYLFVVGNIYQNKIEDFKCK